MLEIQRAYGVGIEHFVAGKPVATSEDTTAHTRVLLFDFAWGYLEERVEEGGRTWLLFALEANEEGAVAENARFFWEQCNSRLPAAVTVLQPADPGNGEFARCFVADENHSRELRLQMAVDVLCRFEDLLRLRLDDSADVTRMVISQLSRK